MEALPPLRALIAFEASVRHGSFLAAARELHLTPGAVGQQVRKLEAWLGAELFDRRIRKVSVTRDGLAYYKSVAAALQQVRQASLAFRQQQGQDVWLSTSPSLAGKWLGPRIARFIAQHPAIKLHLSASTRLADFDNDAVDLAIRYFDGRDPRLAVVPLYRDEVHLYCSPRYRAQLGLATPAELRRATLLHTTLHPLWPAWGQGFAPLSAAEWAALRSVYFDQSSLALEAAKADQGVVLSNPLLAADDLQSGALVEPFAHALRLDTGFFLVFRRQSLLKPSAQALKDWLVAEFSAFAGVMGGEASVASAASEVSEVSEVSMAPSAPAAVADGSPAHPPAPSAVLAAPAP